METTGAHYQEKTEFAASSFLGIVTFNRTMLLFYLFSIVGKFSSHFMIPLSTKLKIKSEAYLEMDTIE